MEDTVTLALNLIGTFAFGLSGGIQAVRKKMDLFGVLVLSVATGLGGGVLRDILLGLIPPAALSDWLYPAAASLGGIIIFVWFIKVIHHGRFLTAFDAVGLGIFTVTGTTIALGSSLNPAASALLGMLTGVGGGVLRDVLAAEVPLIFRSEIYAVASLLGAVIVIVAFETGLLGVPAEIIAAAAVFSLREISVR
ncbi:MAG TPA: trimeric intracellular cation channel family protein, partial [Candidatus Bathyarchaeia archaeon]|nr:trimeric intracellular cation channel family protein [Candidatus Bathyarchaeia archaeon]